MNGQETIPASGGNATGTGGTFVSGVAFSAIDWATGEYSIKTEIDPTGGTTYTITGTSKLLSVPYALYSKNAETVKTNANLTGMVTSIGNETTVVTNAILTGEVISTGNATTIANKITMTATAPVSITGSPTVIASGAVAISIAAATPGTTGSMSAADKTKLDGIATPTHIIGESYGGGIILYLDASGKHGLIAATTDQSTGIRWYNGSYTNTTAFASSIGDGDGNTSMIVFNQGAGAYEAKLCYDLNTGGFEKYGYWSSTEDGSYSAWGQTFGNGIQNVYNGKGNPYYERAVRAF